MEYKKYGVEWRSEMTKFRKWELIDLLKKASEAATNSTAIDELIEKYEKLIKKYPRVCYCSTILKAIREI